MNRAIAAALATVCLPMAFLAGPDPGWAQVGETPADKQPRIDRFQDRRLIFEPGPSPSGSPDPLSYALRQGPDALYDADLIALVGDESLTRFWLQERNRDYAFWIGTGLVGVPSGSVLFYQNFIGQGATALFARPIGTGLDEKAARAVATTNANDWRSFSLSVLGIGLTSYGLYTLSLWLLEELDARHPNRLDATIITPRVTAWNEQLRERLNLEPTDLPSPPTPRPSASPSTSPSPSGFVPPTPPVGGPDSLPAVPRAMPTPLPLITPGGPPSGLIAPGTPRP